MIELISKEIDAHNGPERVTVDNALFWCRHTRELKGSMREKVDALQRLGNIQYLGLTERSKYTFVCLRLDTSESVEFRGIVFKKQPYVVDYNKSEYLMWKEKDGRFNCECQGWNAKEMQGKIDAEGFQCKHTQALAVCFKRKLFGKNEGADQKHLEPDLYE